MIEPQAPTRIPLLRADFYEEESETYSSGSGIHPLDVQVAGVHTGINRQAVTLSFGNVQRQAYGIEVDLSVDSARRLAERLMAAAAAEDRDGAYRDF